MNKATTITLTEKIQNLLEKMTSQAKCPQFLAKRATIILMADKNNSNNKISKELKIHRETVRHWRNKWDKNANKIIEVDKQQLPDKEITKNLTKLIIEILSDEYRPGTPATFYPETIIQIVNIALEKPVDSGLPITNWSTTTIAKEAMKRNIVSTISERSVGRFLKMKQI
jgi:putative transposase